MLCVTHTWRNTHVIMRGEKIETSTDLKFNPQAKDANHSLIMYVCVPVCISGKTGTRFGVFPLLFPTVFTLSAFVLHAVLD